MPGETAQIVESLAAKHRVLVQGGMAVIAHGLSRTTIDADIWLDPMAGIAAWCDCARAELEPYPSAWLFDVSRQRRIERADLEDFDAAWNFATLGLGNARVMDESFLIVTKTDTGRNSDQEDVTFLESKLRSEISARLAVCDAEEAAGHFARYLDHATCQAALGNSNSAVREIGLAGLRELAADGNPFAIAALKKMV
jgi:hypothetical protein